MVFWKSLGIAILFIALAQAIFRKGPLPNGRLSAKPGPDEPGIHPMHGGLKLVRPLAELPAGAFDRLLTLAADTPRTTRATAAIDPAAFVTRTRLWGLPQVTLIWTEADMLHVHAHLVYGRTDFGFNAARVARWFEALERRPDSAP